MLFRSANQWSQIEIVFNYDRTATATNGKTGAFTSYTVRLNGGIVGSADASEGKLYNNVNTFRLFRYTNANLAIDDLSIMVGAKTTYYAGRSSEPQPVQSQIVFKEDFEDAINTDVSQSAVVGANGFVASITNGTTYNLDGGTLNYTDNKYKDYLGLEFYHEGSKVGACRGLRAFLQDQVRGYYHLQNVLERQRFQ